MVFPHDSSQLVFFFLGVVFILVTAAVVALILIVIILVLVQLVMLDVRELVVRVDAAEDRWVNHDAAADVEPHNTVLDLHISNALLQTVVHALQRNELHASLNQLLLDTLRILVILQRVRRKAGDLLVALESLDLHLVIAQSK
jgi:hypothetical protein